MKHLKSSAGFTLIELVLVIIVLGILGAVAMIQFGNITQDARDASLRGMAGAYGAQLAIAVNTLRALPSGGGGTTAGADDGCAAGETAFEDCVYFDVPNPTADGINRSTYDTGNNRFNICTDTNATACSNAIPAANCGATTERFVTVTYTPATGALTIAAPANCAS